MVSTSREVLRNYNANSGVVGGNPATERGRRWETQTMWRADGRKILYDKEVVSGVATSYNVAWLYSSASMLVVCKIIG